MAPDARPTSVDFGIAHLPRREGVGSFAASAALAPPSERSRKKHRIGQYKRILMKWALTLAVLVVLGPGDAAAQRATSPADATVFIRLVGSVHAEFEEAGAANQTTDLERVEIGTGSGFVISPHGYVLTNEHVIRNSEFVVTDGPRKAKISMKVARIDVCFPQGASTGPLRCFEASVHSSDAALDLAVLFISVSDLPYVAMGDSDIVRTGQAVEALGYPFGRQLEVGRVAAPDLVPEISTSAGTISALRAGDAGDRRALQINSTINPGNSGGPVVDRDGFAVGVIRARITGNSGIGFAIPINQAKDFIESRGLDSLMPARRIRLGALQSFDAKGIAMRLPEGVADTSPFRSRIESDPGLTGVALRIDRSLSPWTARQIERTLVGTNAFERLTVAASEGQSSPRAGGAPLLIGRATGISVGSSAEVRMQYGVLDLGAEKLVARYVRISRAAGLQRERAARLAGEPRGSASEHRRCGAGRPAGMVCRIGVRRNESATARRLGRRRECAVGVCRPPPGEVRSRRSIRPGTPRLRFGRLSGTRPLSPRRPPPPRVHHAAGPAAPRHTPRVWSGSACRTRSKAHSSGLVPSRYSSR